MKTELIEVKTSDNLLLPGLIFEPGAKSKKCVIYLHGNGSASVFYSTSETNIYSRVFTDKGISFLAFNNRGSGYVQKIHTTVGEGIIGGTAYELIKDCVIDIDAAIKFLQDRGYEEFYLMGLSTGANKIVVYDKYRKDNPVTKYILLGGGDDTGLYYEAMGKTKFMECLERSEIEVARGFGRRLLPKYYISDMVLLSYQSFFDTCNPNGDYNIFPYYEAINHVKLSTKELFGEYKRIKKPTLVVFGAEDEYCYGDVGRVVKILKDQTKGKKNFSYQMVPNSDHGFTGHEEEAAKLISGWL